MALSKSTIDTFKSYPTSKEQIQSSSSPMQVYVQHLDGAIVKMNLNYPVMVLNNRSAVAVKDVTDNLKADLTWDNSNKIATINKDGKDILLNRKIQRDDFRAFIPEKEIVRYSLSYFSIREARNNEIVFEISFCVPDTDVCYWFELIVSDNGDVKINEIIVEESDM